ncbi:MAG: type I-E CRISPR-associated protein Cse1/CasA [Spirochaetota bacterium]
MNLLLDKWLTVQRKDGKEEKVAPYEITDGLEKKKPNPIVEIITPRADFKGSIYQFLIGVLQPIYSPEDEDAWKEIQRQPPSVVELKQRFSKIAYAFELLGDKQRFMQDMGLNSENKEEAISSLLIDSPGTNTIKENKDHFVKRGAVEKVCLECTAQALLTLQINSPSGGQGHLTSIRGGGPLTTLIIPDDSIPSLWNTIWYNILLAEEDTSNTKDETVFPWLTDRFFKQNSGGSKATTEDLHANAVYWSFPRRILLQTVEEEGTCDICSAKAEVFCKTYLTKTYGLDYGGGGWIHPLSPYYFKKDKDLGDTWFPYHPQSGGILYNHWQAFIYGKTQQDKNAKVLSHFLRVRGKPKKQTVVWAFGYDMDNMKARCWYESRMPIYKIPPEQTVVFEDILTKLLTAASQVASNLQKKVKDAWLNPGSKASGDMEYIKLSFFQATETHFFEIVSGIQDKLKQEEEPLDNQGKLDWLYYLNREAHKLFDTYVESGALEFENIKRITQARKELHMWNLGKKMKKDMQIIEDKTETGGKK